jgi:hypothetical protein
MTDDDRLAELFRAAAADPAAPPPGFDHRDVLSASRRITARRRSALVAGAFGLFAVVGVGAVVAVPDSPTATSAAASAAADRAEANRAEADQVEANRAGAGRADAAQAPAPEAGAQAGKAAERAAAPDAADAAGAAPPAPLAAPFTGAPLGPGRGDCADRQDPQLRAYLEQVLPEVIGAPAAASTDECLPGTQRYVTVEVQDGLFGVSYLPPGTVPELPAGAVSAPTASGGTVIVHSGPMDAGVPPPFLDRLDAVAQFLAPRL